MIFLRSVNDSIRNDYFNWLYDTVTRDRMVPEISVKKLLMYLHDTEFTYTIPNDENRYSDGINMRYRFAINNGYENNYKEILGILDGPCSVLEMMVALASRMEETIMDNAQLGDRTGQWFWQMITNMGLGGQWNDLFDKDYVAERVQKFLDRDYEPNGKGGLFTVRNVDRDLRKVEIWYQMNWYLNTII